mgnify:CR=1 FL=1
MKTVKILAAAAAALLSLTASAKTGASAISIVPYPQSIDVQKGAFKIKGPAVNCDPAMDEHSRDAVAKFAVQLTKVTGRTCTYAAPIGITKAIKNGTSKGFLFYVDPALAEEEYSININKKAVLVAASSRPGFLYAIQTLKQMLPEAIYGSSAAAEIKWTLPCVSIKDKPRFSYRGTHLDCSRHFFSVDEVKKYLDIMAVYKQNRFHWHLTDDQGWRLEIKQYPELTQVGAYRDGTMIAKDWDSNDGIRYGGYYTQDQIREVIAYAHELGITVIPEIDLPGHMLAALTAYPQLGCTGGPYKVWSRWGVSDDVLCVGKEETMTFLENVLAEVAELFPSEYIHIGGDECPKERWKECETCQAKIKELGLKDDEHGTAEQHLQNYVTQRMQAFLATKGKRIIGWDEVLEGKLGEGTTIMAWRGVKHGLKAIEQGFDVIMTPNSHCYIDYYQSKDKDNEPLAIGGYLPWKKIYRFDPCEGVPAGKQSHILGPQCNLWTEYIATNEHLEYMLLPRIIAMSEVQWCDLDNKDIDRFETSLNGHQYKILDIMGYNYRKDR